MEILFFSVLGFNCGPNENNHCDELSTQNLEYLTYYIYRTQLMFLFKDKSQQTQNQVHYKSYAEK